MYQRRIDGGCDTAAGEREYLRVPNRSSVGPDSWRAVWQLEVSTPHREATRYDHDIEPSSTGVTIRPARSRALPGGVSIIRYRYFIDGRCHTAHGKRALPIKRRDFASLPYFCTDPVHFCPTFNFKHRLTSCRHPPFTGKCHEYSDGEDRGSSVRNSG
jgi:hypothetical protein